MTHEVKFHSHGRKARCAPDPDYPNGKDIDLAPGVRNCEVLLPYPAECCGLWLIACTQCGTRVGVTAAGRPDDPRSVLVACKGG
jgi:hypothetical protein